MSKWKSWEIWYKLKISETLELSLLTLFGSECPHSEHPGQCIALCLIRPLFSEAWQLVIDKRSTLSTILKLGDARKRVSAVYSNASTRERGWPGVSIVLRLGCNIVQSLKLFNYGGGEYGVPKGWVGVVMMQTKGRVTLPKWMNFS